MSSSSSSSKPRADPKAKRTPHALSGEFGLIELICAKAEQFVGPPVIFTVMTSESGSGEPLGKVLQLGAFREEANARAVFFREVDNLYTEGVTTHLYSLLKPEHICRACRIIRWHYDGGKEEGGAAEPVCPGPGPGLCRADEAVSRMRTGEQEAEEFFDWQGMLCKDEPDGRVGMARTTYALSFMTELSDGDMNVTKVLMARQSLS
jgi:hypothetical protein